MFERQEKRDGETVCAALKRYAAELGEDFQIKE